jgi:L,D-transpeptidase YcbB
MNHLIKILLISFVFLSCTKENKLDTSISQSGKNQTDLFLSAPTISSYFTANPENEKIVNEVTLFYKNRNFHYAWFNPKGMTQAVPNFQNQLLNYSNDFDDKTINVKQLDTLITLIKTNNQSKAKRKFRVAVDYYFF